MKPKFRKMSLIARSALTFQSYLNGEFGKRFYTDEFLTGICKTRTEIHASLAKTSGLLISSTMLLAFFDLLPKNIILFSNNIELSKPLIPIINVFVAINLFSTVTKFIDSVAIDRYINKLGENIDIYSFNLFLLDKNPVNLWSEPMVPRYFGEKSGLGHKLILPFLGIMFFILLFSLILSISVLVITTAYNNLITSDFSVKPIVISLIPTIFISITLFLILAFFLRYKFYEAEFDEYNLEPTDYFKSKLQNEMGAQPTSHPTPTQEAPPAHAAR
ncbi:hypothetical protein [Rhizobium sp.]|jgi:hypothetical protein|uniref:hypothetical protein n=1 Tax=Rhizobium sp. TaxID=391 RepID=UPI000E9C0739|nr:hypothetical protein [Rhizobium sp.]